MDFDELEVSRLRKAFKFYMAHVKHCEMEHIEGAINEEELLASIEQKLDKGETMEIKYDCRDCTHYWHSKGYCRLRHTETSVEECDDFETNDHFDDDDDN